MLRYQGLRHILGDKAFFAPLRRLDSTRFGTFGLTKSKGKKLVEAHGNRVKRKGIYNKKDILYRC
jgi:hypothetical protein